MTNVGIASAAILRRGVDVLAGSDLALDDRAGDRRIDRHVRADGAGLSKLGDFIVGHSENAQPVARHLERSLGRTNVIFRCACGCLRSLQISQRSGPRVIEGLVLLLDDPGEFQSRAGLIQVGDRSDEIILCLHHVRRFHDEKRLAHFHGVARLCQQLDHAAGVRREHQRCAVLIDGNLAFCQMLGAEDDVGDRRNGQRGPLLWSRVVRGTFAVALRRLFLLGNLVRFIRAGRPRRRADRQPGAKNQRNNGNRAVACNCLRLREPRHRCCNELHQGIPNPLSSPIASVIVNWRGVAALPRNKDLNVVKLPGGEAWR